MKLDSPGRVSELLWEAKLHILHFSNWTHGYYARDRDGNPCTSNSYDAQSWCALGALECAMADLGYRHPNEIADQAETLLNAVTFAQHGIENVGILNDQDATDLKVVHRDVLDVYRSAVELANWDNAITRDVLESYYRKVNP